MASPDFSSLLDATQVRERLRGGDFRRHLEELAREPGFVQWAGNEFPRQFWDGENTVSRRHFLKLLGASLALAGLAGCAHQPRETVVPYVNQPELLVPGKPLHFATAITRGGYALGILVENHEGRPTKIEGNPAHPATLGAADAVTQAQILELYDPDRAREITLRGQSATWDEFVSALNATMSAHREDAGAGLRILSETTTSPTLTAQIERLLARYPQARWHVWDALHRDNARAGALLAFGSDVQPIYRFERARVILSLDCDFLLDEAAGVPYARDFMDGRRVRSGDGTGARMNRLYALESTPTLTGAIADHAVALPGHQIEAFARLLAARLGVPGVGVPGAGVPGVEGGELPTAISEKWLAALLGDLQAERGAGLVVAGRTASPTVHALAYALNELLDNTGKTISYMQPLAAGSNPGSSVDSLRTLTDDMAAGRVQTLLVLGGNPAFCAPADVPFAAHLARVPFSARLGLHPDETARGCLWNVPQSHELESWGDARGFDGTVTIQQPLIAPLFDGKSALELLAVALGEISQSDYDAVRAYWSRQQSGDFDLFWRTTLHDGLVANSAAPLRSPHIKPNLTLSPPRTSSGLELNFRPDPYIGDGRHANNGWLQELPRPITTLTWSNAALLGPATARQLGVRSEDEVELRLNGRALRVPALVVPTHAEGAVTLHFGQGRTQAGEVGNGIGVNVYPLRDSIAQWSASGLEVGLTGKTVSLAFTQNHHSMEGRDLSVTGTLAQWRSNATFPRANSDHDFDKKRDSFYPEVAYKDRKWGMAIDLNACIGCNACTLACQAENNIPVVGQEEVARGREMHWIRVDTYFADSPDAPPTSFQPVPCMHCEKAPCEPVCPVGATLHSTEGLNMQVYNRCVGTRYCSNNCPYKVRRFNFLEYTDFSDRSLLPMAQNPDVTVRNRGVMEKCTYCIQRIQKAKIEAERTNSPLRDGDIVPACAQTCPTQAIVFGDLNDSSSQVAKLRAEPLSYGLLLQLNTQPRTSYLARLRNPHPDLEGAS